MKVVRQARLELSGGSTPDQLRPPSTTIAQNVPTTLPGQRRKVNVVAHFSPYDQDLVETQNLLQK